MSAPIASLACKRVDLSERVREFINQLPPIQEVHMSVRAKFRVNQVTEGKSTLNGEERKYREDVVAGAVYDPDPKGANRSWSEATPYGELKMAITNPGAFGQFKVGQEIYVDFTPAEA